MAHGIFYLKTCPRPTSVTKARHGTQRLRIEFIWLHQNMGAKRPNFFLYKNDYAGRKAPRYSNKKQDPQREAL
jgi:hypothetical protein